MVPRVIWKGSISFGLVTIPVQLFSAVSRKSVRFNQLDAETGARVRYKKVSSADDTELTAERIVKGYELPSGDYVTVTDRELEELAPVAARTIDIDAFIDLADIDPVFYDSAYHLVPDEATAKPYKLLAEAMGEADKVGICHFVMRSKQYLAAIRPVDGRLMLSTMVYSDELVAPDEIDGLYGLDDIEVDERETAMARQLIAALEADFEPGRYTRLLPGGPAGAHRAQGLRRHRGHGGRPGAGVGHRRGPDGRAGGLGGCGQGGPQAPSGGRRGCYRRRRHRRCVSKAESTGREGTQVCLKAARHRAGGDG